jgi:hypothetical protein
VLARAIDYARRGELALSGRDTTTRR